MAPEVNLLDHGEDAPQEGPIDPLAKFNRVMSVISGINPNCKNKSKLGAKKLNNTADPL